MKIKIFKISISIFFALYGVWSLFTPHILIEVNRAESVWDILLVNYRNIYLTIINFLGLYVFFLPFFLCVQSFSIKNPISIENKVILIMQGIIGLFFNAYLFIGSHLHFNYIEYLPARKFLDIYFFLCFLFCLWSILLPTFIGKQLGLHKILEEKKPEVEK